LKKAALVLKDAKSTKFKKWLHKKGEKMLQDLAAISRSCRRYDCGYGKNRINLFARIAAIRQIVRLKRRENVVRSCSN